MDPIRVSVVSPSEIKKEKGSVTLGEGVMSVDAIPNLDILTGHVFEILEYLEKPKNKALLKSNESAVKMMLNNKYADTVPYGIITILMEEENREENVDRLIKMFETLQKAKDGKADLEKESVDFTEHVKERFVYSKYGSKENFEKALEEESKKEAKKKQKNK